MYQIKFLNFFYFLSVCEISVSDRFKPNQPLFKVLGANRLLLPNNNAGKIVLETNESIEVCCPNLCDTQICVEGVEYNSIDGTPVNSTTDWVCQDKFEPEVRAINQSCLNKGQWLISGIKYNKVEFMELYRVCFDFVQSAPLLVVHQLNKNHLKQQPNVDCPSTWFHRGFFESISNPNAKFTKTASNGIIAVQLKDVLLSHSIVNKDSYTQYLAKGHMAPKGDFVFAPEKLGTCSLVSKFITHV